jgi:hypothetical protein
MNDAELAAFRDRCHRAAVRGYAIAHADLYVAALQDEAGDVEPPLGAAEGSAAHLAALAQATLNVRAGTGKKAKAKAKPKPAPAPPPEPEEPEVEEEDEGDEEVPYEEWDFKELYALSQEYEIPGRSNMTKDELIEALEAYDDEHGE